MKIYTIEELFENNGCVKYRWREPYNNIWHETKCEVISHNGKTATIKLLEFGKNGMRPGTILKRVHLKSLIGFNDVKEPDMSWKKYTYFD